jgi:hypothetical protein
MLCGGLSSSLDCAGTSVAFPPSKWLKSQEGLTSVQMHWTLRVQLGNADLHTAWADDEQTSHLATKVSLPPAHHLPHRTHTLLRKLLLPWDPLGAVDIPGGQPHCCGGSWQTEHLAGSPEHLQTPETPSRQTQCPRYSHPTSSPHQESPGGGCYSHRWWLSPLHMSVSLQRPHQLRQWHGRRLTPGWLWKKEMGVSRAWQGL